MRDWAQKVGDWDKNRRCQFKISCTNIWRRNSFWEIVTLTIWHSFYTFDLGDLDLWPSEPRTDVWTNFEEGRSRRSQFIDRKQFWHIWLWWPWPLTQWPPKSKGFPGRLCGQSLRKVGQGILETKKLQTDRQTDQQIRRHTDQHVQSNMPSLLRRRGITSGRLR